MCVLYKGKGEDEPVSLTNMPITSLLLSLVNTCYFELSLTTKSTNLQLRDASLRTRDVCAQCGTPPVQQLYNMRKHLYTYLRYRIQSDSESVTHMHRAHTRVHCEPRTGSEFMCVRCPLYAPLLGPRALWLCPGAHGGDGRRRRNPRGTACITNTARVWPVSSLSLVPADTLEVFDVRGEDRRTPELQACRTNAQAAVSP